MTRAAPLLLALVLIAFSSCQSNDLLLTDSPSASEILGNPAYPAISYGGYRGLSRQQVPSLEELKEDMRILHALGIRIIRTYNTQKFGQTPVLLEAIKELKEENPDFEMYVMLGAWIECQGAFGPNPDHSQGDSIANRAEVETAVGMARRYPDIIKVIAVGNESMVHWASSYFVSPAVVLRWVNHLKEHQEKGELPEELWITSSDNFAAWGGESDAYHNDDLKALIKAVDFISLHSYPFHDTHYNNDFWLVPKVQDSLAKLAQIDSAMLRARHHLVEQYEATRRYMRSLGINKPIHIGETGWASEDVTQYGPQGSRAADEYKQKLFHDHLRQWSEEQGISCFYFQAFDEPWKDASNEGGSENHFGLFTVDGQAKYVIWDAVDEGLFEGLSRGGKPIRKTYNGAESAVMAASLAPPSPKDIGQRELNESNPDRSPGEQVSEKIYLIHSLSENTFEEQEYSRPSASLRLNAWEGSSMIELRPDGVIELIPGSSDWWGAALEMSEGGEDMSRFGNGELVVTLKAAPQSSFELGLQTGVFALGNQNNYGIALGKGGEQALTGNWQSLGLPLSELAPQADLSDVRSLLYIMSNSAADDTPILIREIYYQRP